MPEELHYEWYLSRPTRARGLKFNVIPRQILSLDVAPHTGARIEMMRYVLLAKSMSSRPTRARGLKFAELLPRHSWLVSRPTRARGLKYVANPSRPVFLGSRPTRARGLKLHGAKPGADAHRRAPHGRAD